MKEKKLTDEEIVKALEHCLNGDYKTKCKDCPYDNSENYCQAMDRDVLDLIHRLQAENEQLKCDTYKTSWKSKFLEAKKEIERLTEELDLANETIDRNNKRYEKVSIERQKALDRVDFLEDALLDKIRRNEELITAIKQAEQQAVKDTAREICDLILEHWGKKQFVECDWLRVAISEKYGVEVE